MNDYQRKELAFLDKDFRKITSKCWALLEKEIFKLDLLSLERIKCLPVIDVENKDYHAHGQRTTLMLRLQKD